MIIDNKKFEELASRGVSQRTWNRMDSAKRAEYIKKNPTSKYAEKISKEGSTKRVTESADNIKKQIRQEEEKILQIEQKLSSLHQKLLDFGKIKDFHWEYHCEALSKAWYDDRSVIGPELTLSEFKEIINSCNPNGKDIIKALNYHGNLKYPSVKSIYTIEEEYFERKTNYKIIRIKKESVNGKRFIVIEISLD